MNHDHSQNGSEPKGFWSSRYAIGLLVMGAVATVLYHAQRRAMP